MGSGKHGLLTFIYLLTYLLRVRNRNITSENTGTSTSELNVRESAISSNTIHITGPYSWM